MKKGLTSLMCASALLGASSFAFAGAYGEAEQPEEMPAPAPAPAAAYVEPESDARIMRQFENFATDAETARGLWAELSSMYYDEGNDVDAISTIATLAYGQEMFEVGLQLPYEWFDVDGGPSDDGLGDLDFYGKVVPLRTDEFSLGGGLVVHAPTGDTPNFSIDEWGFNPFITGALAVGEASVRATVGYDVYQDVDFFDAVTYNFAGLVPVAENVVLRGELDCAHATERNFDEDPVRFVPGVDVYFPLGGFDLILRPTGSVGINDAEDWGLGLGIALAQSAS